MAYLRGTRGDAVARLRTRLKENYPPPLPAWAARARTPGPRPWAHLDEVLRAL